MLPVVLMSSERVLPAENVLMEAAAIDTVALNTAVTLAGAAGAVHAPQ